MFCPMVIPDPCLIVIPDLCLIVIPDLCLIVIPDPIGNLCKYNESNSFPFHKFYYLCVVLKTRFIKQ